MMYCNDELILYRSIDGGSSLEEWLILSEPFSSESLFLGGPHRWGLIVWVVQQDKHMARLLQVVLHDHREFQVGMLSSSNVWYHGSQITTDESENLDERLSCQFAVGLG